MGQCVHCINVIYTNILIGAFLLLQESSWAYLPEQNVKKDFAYFRIINITAEESENLDLRMLRSFRVLRPLKLVSRTPSKSEWE